MAGRRCRRGKSTSFQTPRNVGVACPYLPPHFLACKTSWVTHPPSHPTLHPFVACEYSPNGPKTALPSDLDWTRRSGMKGTSSPIETEISAGLFRFRRRFPTDGPVWSRHACRLKRSNNGAFCAPFDSVRRQKRHVNGQEMRGIDLE